MVRTLSFMWMFAMAFLIAFTLTPIVSAHLLNGTGMLFIGLSVSLAGIAIKEAVDGLTEKIKK
jgi:hypothetical protein